MFKIYNKANFLDFCETVFNNCYPFLNFFDIISFFYINMLSSFNINKMKAILKIIAIFYVIISISCDGLDFGSLLNTAQNLADAAKEQMAALEKYHASMSYQMSTSTSLSSSNITNILNNTQLQGSYNEDGSINVVVNANANGKPIAAVSAIKDSVFSKYANLIGLLSYTEQAIIANCHNSNTDADRFVDPDCFRTSFDSFKSVSSRAIGQQLTNNSQTIRGSMSCLTATTAEFKESSDDTVTSNINESVGKVVSQQSIFNSASAAFAKTVAEIMNARRRFFLTTKVILEETTIFDSYGMASGFIFSKSERDTIVSAFKIYSQKLSNFMTNLNQEIIYSQNQIGSLSKCQGFGSIESTSTSSSSSISNGNTLNPSSSDTKSSSSITNPFESNLNGLSSSTNPFGSNLNGLTSALSSALNSGNINTSSLGDLINNFGNLAGGLFGGKTRRLEDYNSLMQKISDLQKQAMNGGDFNSIMKQVQELQKQAMEFANNAAANANAISNQFYSNSNFNQSTPSLNSSLGQNFNSNYLNGNLNFSSGNTQNNGGFNFNSGNIQSSNSIDTNQYFGGSSQPNMNDLMSQMGGIMNSTFNIPGSLNSDFLSNLGFSNIDKSKSTNANLAAAISAGSLTGEHLKQALAFASKSNVIANFGIQTGVTDKVSLAINSLGSETLSVDLKNRMQITLINNTASYKPSPMLHSTISSYFNEQNLLKEEFSKIFSSSICDTNYTFVCTGGACDCMGEGCPNNLKSKIQLTTKESDLSISDYTGSSQNADFSVNINFSAKPSLSSYFFSSFCTNGKRYIFSTADINPQGLRADFIFSSSLTQSYGASAASLTNKCQVSLTQSNSTAKAACRGDMTQQCSANLDATCKNTGLYTMMTKNPAPKSSLPDECNEDLSSYSDDSCFKSIISQLTFGSIAIDIEGFNSLANFIQGNSGTSKRDRRNLATTVKENDSSKSDSKAQVDGSVNDSDMAVDNSTSTKAANPKLYANNLNNSTTTTKVSSSSFIVTNGIYVIFISLMILFF